MNEIFNLRTMLRSLKNNKMFSAINILGFAVSLSLVILIGGLYIHESSIDDSQPQKQQIYLTSMLIKENNGQGGLPPAFAEAVKAATPQIKSFCRIDALRINLEREDNSYNVAMIRVDSTFFDILKYRFVEGDSQSFSRGDISQIVLTQAAARKIFGNEPAVGKIIDIPYKMEDQNMNTHKYKLQYMVSGVVEDFKNTIINPDTEAIVEFNAIKELYNGDLFFTGWNAGRLSTLFLAEKDVDLRAKVPEIETWLRKQYWIYDYFKDVKLNIVPLKQAYFDKSINYKEELNGFDLSRLHLLLSVAIIILIFAVINFINLSISQSGERIREYATRQMLGSSRLALISKYIVESMFMCLVALSIAAMISLSVQEDFYSLINLPEPLLLLLPGWSVPVMIIFVIMLSLVCGIFPALAITRFTPLDIIKGNTVISGRKAINNSLVVIQYTITMGLLICSYITYSQVEYFLKTDPGFNRDNIFVVENTLGHIHNLDQEIRRIPGVESVGVMRGSMLNEYNFMFQYNQGEPAINALYFECDTATFDMLGYHIDSLFFSGGSKEGLYLNQTMLSRLHLAKGEYTLHEGLLDGMDSQIKGVIKDFHSSDLTRPISPVFLQVGKVVYPWNIMVRLSKGDQIEAIAEIEKKYKERAEGSPYKGYFLDQALQRDYEGYKKMSMFINVMTVIAIIIALLGILAITIFYISQRRREIAIRKVHGETIAQLMRRLMKGFAVEIAIAFVIAAPVCYYIESSWLSSFAFHISISIWHFILPLLLITMISGAIIIARSYSAACRNPQEAL